MAPTNATKAKPFDMKLEVVVLGVSDVDRAKAFYENLGWRLDADFTTGDDWRVCNLRLTTRRPRSFSGRE
jgi:catechol 2,3-dioxygenase-like lactoylglutathione lyase family enzyme